MPGSFAGEVPKLGFGLMRLLGKGLSIDDAQVGEMVDLFMEAGFACLDTAFVYPDSETAIKKALVDRSPKKSYTLCTKLNASLMGATEKSTRQQLETSLKRTSARYFDYCLPHAPHGEQLS